jgi:hypothetical protein
MPAWESDALILGKLAEVRDVLGTFREFERALVGEIQQRMRERNATVVATDTHEAKLEIRREYNYNTETLASLQAYVPAEEYEQAVQTVPATIKVNKTRLNALAKRGGKVAEVIAAATTEVPSDPRVVVSKRTVSPRPEPLPLASIQMPAPCAF